MKSPHLGFLTCLSALAFAVFCITLVFAVPAPEFSLQVLNRSRAATSVTLKVVLPGGQDLATSNVVNIPPGETRRVAARTTGFLIPRDARFDLAYVGKGDRERQYLSGPADGSVTKIAIGLPSQDERTLEESQTEEFGESEAKFTITNKSKAPIATRLAILDARGATLEEELRTAGREISDERTMVKPGQTRTIWLKSKGGDPFPRDARFRCLISDSRSTFLQSLEGSLSRDSRALVYAPGTESREKSEPLNSSGETRAEFALVTQEQAPVSVKLGIGLPGSTEIEERSGAIKGLVLVQTLLRKIPAKTVTPVTLTCPSGAFPSDAVFFCVADFGKGKSELLVGNLKSDSRRLLLGRSLPQGEDNSQRLVTDESEQAGGSSASAVFFVENKMGQPILFTLQVLGPDGSVIVSSMDGMGGERASSQRESQGTSLANNARTQVALRTPDHRVFPAKATWRLMATLANSQAPCALLTGSLRPGGQAITVARTDSSGHQLSDQTSETGSTEATFTILNRAKRPLGCQVHIGVERETSAMGSAKSSLQVRGPVLAQARVDPIPAGGQRKVVLRSRDVPFTKECNFIVSFADSKLGHQAVVGNFERDSHTVIIGGSGDSGGNDELEGGGDGGRELESPGLESQVTFTIQNRLNTAIEAKMSLLRADGSLLVSESKPGAKGGVSLDKNSPFAVAPKGSRSAILANPNFQGFPRDATWRCVVSKAGVVRRILEGSLARDSRLVSISALDQPDKPGPREQEQSGGGESISRRTELSLRFSSMLPVPCELLGGLVSGSGAALGQPAAIKLGARGAGLVTFKVPGGIPADVGYSFRGTTRDRRLEVRGNVERDGSTVRVSESSYR